MSGHETTRRRFVVAVGGLVLLAGGRSAGEAREAEAA